jgi:outer membrane protein
MPTITLQGSASRSKRGRSHARHLRTDQASVIGQLTQPIYDGGTAASQTRQAKEVAAQSRLVLDQVRNQARTAAIGAWVANEGAKIAVAASESEVRAATVALQGVQREAQGGQRTTVDVLNSQQDLISAKARLIGAQRDRVIASYTLLSAIGRLDVKTLASTRRTICRRCTTIRCATPGTACARRRGSREKTNADATQYDACLHRGRNDHAQPNRSCERRSPRRR